MLERHGGSQEQATTPIVRSFARSVVAYILFKILLDEVLADCRTDNKRFLHTFIHSFIFFVWMVNSRTALHRFLDDPAAA